MTFTSPAIYQQGMLQLMQPIDLPEGTSVKVIITVDDSTQESENLADVLAQIAALPLEGDRENFSGRDHDRILYPRQE